MTDRREPAIQSYLTSLVARLAGVDPGRLDGDRPLLALGLDSLAMVELQAAVEDELGVELPVADLLDGITLRELAARLAGAAPVAGARTSPVAGAKLLPAPQAPPAVSAAMGTPALSPGQRALWVAHQLAPESSAYTLAAAARQLSGAPAAAWLPRALQALLDRHPALRTTCSEGPAGPQPRVLERAELAWRLDDASGWDPGRLERRLGEEAFRPFDLERGPLLRATLFTGPPEGDVLVLAVHHLAADFASFGVLARELGTLAAGGTLDPPPPSMAEAVQRQAVACSGPRGDASREWWLQRLAGAPPLELPIDRPRSPQPTFRGGARTAVLPAALLADLARGRRATPFMAALAAFTALLARVTGQEDFLVGTPLSQRSAEGLGRQGGRAGGFSGTVGYLVNPVALRADAADEPTAGDLVERARRATLDAFAHQDFPFALLAERLQPERGAGGPPLLQAMLVLHRAPAPELQALAAFALGLGGARLRLGEIELASLPLENPGAQLDLTLQAAELDGCLAVSLSFNSDLFDAATAERLLGHLDNLARGMAAAPSLPVWDLDLLAEAERRQLAAWNATTVARGGDAACLHQLFEAQAARTPEAPAVVAGEGVVTYQELNRRANQVAHRLRRLGVGPEARVGVLLDRTPDMPAGLLGVLKAGGAYVPLDPAYPRERLQLMAGDAGVGVLVTVDGLAGPAGLGGLHQVRLDGEREALGREDGANPALLVTPQNLAYVIYTSGSTGRPKGVAIEHRSPVELVRWARGAFADAELAGVLAATSVCFDLSVFELFVPLACGGRVILAGNALALPALAAAGAVSLLNTVPSAMAELAEGDLPPGLVTVNLAGEPLPPRLVERLRRHRQVRRILNLYGPTEDTTYSTGESIGADAARITIGRPLDNTRAHLLDRRSRSVPIGVAGEICLAGAGLARGYLGRPDLTAERFVPDPDDGAGGRLYRTGDLGRYGADGRLEFLGRIDHQVKIRGFRVEPGEIEAVLAAHPGVSEVCVTVREDLPGGRGLVAYAAPVALPAVGELRAFLRGKLPAHLVPDHVVLLDRLPRTHGGKVDRLALPGPVAGPEAAWTPPRTPVEEIVAQAWAELLGRERVGAHEDFFALGGHSLMVPRAVARLRELLDVELPLAALFRQPTVAGVAAVVEGLRGAGGAAVVEGRRGGGGAAAVPPLVRLTRPAGEAPDAAGVDSLSYPLSYPLSFAQERLWFLEQLAPGLAVYNLPAAVRLSGPLAVAALGRALAGAVRRHEALRTTYSAAAGPPVQVVAPPAAAGGPGGGPLAVVDLSALGLAPPDGGQRLTAPVEEGQRLAVAEKEGLRLAAVEARRPFDLGRGPVLRAGLVRLSPVEHLLVLDVHHIAADGWSLRVLAEELSAGYGAALRGKDPELAALPVQYGDYAAWQRQAQSGAALASELAWWRQRLAGAPASSSPPADRARPAAQGFRGAVEAVALSGELVGSLRALARGRGATLFMALLAGWSALVERLSGQGDVVVGTAVANRVLPEVEGLIGLFVNTLPLRVSASGESDFGSALGRARESALGAYGHAEVPFERLVEELEPVRDLSRSPLFQVLLVLQEDPAQALRLPGLSCRPVAVHGGTSKFDLTLSLAEGAGGAEGGLAGSLEYDTALFERSTARRLADQLAALLAAAAADAAAPIGDLPLLAAAERRQLLEVWGRGAAVPWAAGAVAGGVPRGLYEGVAAQAGRSPDAVAVAWGGERWSYRELLRQAAGLGRRLRRLGVGPETRVGVLAERRPEMVAALLGVVGAGGAYVPLDATWPRQRLAWLLADSGARVVVASPSLAGMLPAWDGEVIWLGAGAAGSVGVPAAVGEPAGVGAGEPAGGAVAVGGSVGVAAAGAGAGVGGPVSAAAAGAGAAVDGPAGAVGAGRPTGDEFAVAAGAGAAIAGGPAGDDLTMVPAGGCCDGEQLAYVIYTSGSTGVPKGVGIRQRSVAARLAWAAAAYGEHLSGVLAATSISFDLSVFELFAPLWWGGTAILAEDALALPELVGRGAVTLLNTVPSALAELVRAGAVPASVRVVNAAGEPLRRELVARLYELPWIEAVHDLYGPTEDTTYSTGALAGRGAAGEPAIGRPLPGSRALVLDGGQRLLPPGAVGELWLGGEGLARGYLGRPELTAERFRPDPFAAAPGERLYRTGDLARWGGDGELAFVGRRDHQVKVRGYRIELEEVEAALLAHAAVAAAAVVVRGEAGGGPGLVAYVAPAAGQTVEPGALRRWLGERLPRYMVPATVVPLATLPRLASGKVDRRALPPPPADAMAGVAGVATGAGGWQAPRDPFEEAVCEVWADLLGRERVGIHEDFFALGGHSLLAARLAGQLTRTLGVELPLRQLFATPTVAGLAAAARAARQDRQAAGAVPASPPLLRLARSAPPAREVPPGAAGVDPVSYPLSFAQERLWFLEQLAPGLAVYNLPVAVRLSGRLMAAALGRALAGAVRRHEALRTTYSAAAGPPVQVVAPPAAGGPGWGPLAVVDLSALGLAAAEKGQRLTAPEEERQRLAAAAEGQRLAAAEEEGLRLAAAAARRPFDLGRGPVLRAGLVRLSPSEHLLLLDVHHIAADGWSLRVLAEELSAGYGAALRGEEPELAALPVQYGDYAAWQRQAQSGAALAAGLAWWRQRLAGAPASSSPPADRARPAAQGFRGAVEAVALPGELVGSLRALARGRGATLFMALLAGWSALVERLSGQADVVVGTAVANRVLPEVEGLIGLFVNTLPLRVSASGESDFGSALGRARESALGAYGHAEVPFERLVEELEPVRDLSRSPLFQVLLVLQEDPAQALRLPGLSCRPVGVHGGTSKFDLTLSLAEGAGGSEGGLAGSLEYDTALFEGSTARRLADQLAALLAAAAADAAAPVGDLPLLAAAERRQLLEVWGRGAAVPGAVGAAAGAVPRGLYEGVAAQAGRSPDAVAVAWGGERWSYRELLRQAAGLGRRLRRLGVGPETRVGVLAERRPEMVAALLGVLGPGGAYVPLDAAWPRQRLAWLLADSGARVVVASRSLAGSLPAWDGEVVWLGDGAAAAGAGAVADRPAGAAIAGGPVGDDFAMAAAGGCCHGEQLAYVIYTSGSTGVPKGVGIRQRSVAARLAWAAAAYGQQLSGVLAATSITFDLSVFELFAPLWWGGTAILADDALALPELAGRGAVTLLNTVPSALAELVRAGAVPASVRVVNAAGEPLRRELVARLYELPWIEAVHDLYGPTEDTTYSTGALAGRGAAGEPAIGRPLPGSRALVLDGVQRLLPPGAVGELWLGGEGLARGYLGRPELTAERFRPDPFAAAPGERLYRTGDLARWGGDGELAFVGRRDHQVKVRGYRIELEEVETALLAHAAVAAAAVVVRGEAGGGPGLVAYVSPAAGQTVDPGALRRWLGERLPRYMVPATVVPLATLPRLASGKVDRRALPPPPADATAGVAGVAAAAAGAGCWQGPRDPFEEAVCEVWASLLERERVGIHEDFFALGGHSLLAARLTGQLARTLGVELPLRQLFATPTVAGLAAAARAARQGGRRATAPAILPAPERLTQPVGETTGAAGVYPLSFAQEREWLLDQLEPGTPAYNIPQAVRLRGPLNLPALRLAFGEIADRHEALRTTFPAAAGRPVQVVAAALDLRQPVVDLAPLPLARAAAESLRLAVADARFSFDLARGPLIRTSILRRGPAEHVLLLNTHHMVSDLWSIGVLLRELATLYGELAAGRRPRLPPLAVQYADYAVWQRQRLQGEVLDGLLAFWRERLGGARPPLQLPTDRPRPLVQSFRGADTALRLGPELSRATGALAHGAGASLFMTLLGVFTALLHRLSGETDLTVGTFVANRSQPEVEPLIGFFINTLALRAAVLPEAPFQELLAGVRETSLDALAHQELPFEKLLAELHPERSLSHTPLFQAMFVFQNTPGLETRLPGLELEPLAVPAWRSNFDLTLWMWQGKEGLEGSLHYSSDLLDRTTAQRWAGHFQTLLAAAAAAPAQAVGRLPLLAAAEREQLLRQWSRAPAGYRRDVRLHELFAEQAARTPESPALAFAGSTLTYGELAARSGRLARALRAAGVGPEVRVGLLAGRDPELAIGLLAILQAGGAFLPLDPGTPPARQAWLLADAGVGALLAQERLAASLPAPLPPLVLLDAPLPRQAAGVPAAPRVPADALAWLIYTSGSTGNPKGVAVSHANAAPLLLWTLDYFALGPETRVLQSLSQTFDFGVLEILCTLLAGGVLHLAGDAFGDPRRWAEDARRHGVDTVHATPSFFGAVAALGVRLPAVRILHLGGEAVFYEQAERLLAAAGESCVLHNGYGPTEVTVNCTIHAAGRERAWPAGEAVPIGRPTADNTTYVVDPQGEPAPPGVPGELLLGGPGVARGYHGRPELTAARFVPDPFGDEPGARLYRSGDLVRWLADGSLEFLGRADHQLKIRGFRIEPGEIEAALTRHPEVSQAVVVAHAAAAGERRLVAYVVGAAGAAPPARVLRELLAESLPAYMVPSELVALDALPLTPAGKLDRRALPAPESAPEPPDLAAPRTPAEELAAGIWEEVLGVERVGVHDNFFALGGHSLVAAQIAARLQDALGVEVTLRAFFEAPTVAELALRLESAGGSGVPPLHPAPRGNDLPPSFAQERIWFLAQLDPESAAYHVPRAVWITGRLDVPALARAYAALLERHEILRTAFPEVDGRPVQRIQPSAPAAWSRLPLLDLRAVAEPRRRRELERLIVADGRRLFDLARGPLLRASVARTGDEEHVVIQTEHHLVHDGWAEAVLLGDLLELYAARTQRRPSRLPTLPIQYADYACWQRDWLRGEVLERQVAYWRAQLAGAPPLLALPTDRPRPPVLSARGRAHEVMLDGALMQRLTALGRRLGATLFMTMLAGFAAVLHRWSGQPDVVVSTSIANRRRREMEGMLGMVINTLALRADLAGDPRLRALLARVRDTCLGAYAHQDTPFDRVVDALGGERTLSRAPLAQAHFAFHDARFPEVDLPGLTLAPGELHNRSSKFDLTLVLRPLRERTATGPARGGMMIHHEYSSDLFDPPTMLRLIGHYQVLLAGLAASAGDGPLLSELPLLSAPERFQLLWEQRPAALGAAPASCLHELFAERARRVPGAVAVTGEGESLTYGELDRRADQLARHLRRLGVGPEVRVGICVGRSPLLIVGLLGILKAGGAYVPLSPSDPAERLQLILEDALAGAPAPLLLAAGVDAATLRLPAAVRVLHLDAGWGPIAAASGEPPVSGALTSLPPLPALPANTAYVIYTSGSTGRPKGVEIPHANVVRLFAATRPWFGFGPGDVWTLFHSPAFDFSVWEIWGALLHGGRLVIVPYPVSRAPRRFRQLLVREGVTVLNQTPSAFRSFSEAEEAEAAEAAEVGAGAPESAPAADRLALRWVIFGGEALELSALAPWFARRGDAVPRLINMYGITETTVHVTWRPVTSADLQQAHRSPLGVPIPDLRLQLLDGFGNLAPLGVAGEIHVGGAGLARGYLGRPELTAERFVPDPFAGPAGEPGARLYRSGDLARRRPDGDLDYLGRIDSQVKIRGFRIELGEIEAALARHPAVRRTVVVAHRRQDGLRQLVAYLVGEEGVGIQTLRAFVGRQLPDYMVPALIVWLPELPLTPHGKVDLRALPEPAAARRELDAPFAPPEGAVEAALAEVWEAVLGVGRVGRGDNFFALGGDSILSLRVLAAARARRIELSLPQLFLHQTVRELALAAGEMRRDGARAARDAGDASDAGAAGDPNPLPFALISAADRARVPAGVEDAYPLTQMQGGLVFHSELRPGSAVYHDIFSYHLGGVCDVRALRRAIRRLAARHPILRTAFDLTSYGEPLQLVHRSVEMRLPVEDLRHLDPDAQERVLAAMVEAEKARPFVWNEAPLWHCRCHLRGADSFQFTMIGHHAILDGWSVASLTSELFRLYLEPAGRAAAPPPVSRFSRYLALERQALASEETRRFWQAATRARPEMLPRWPRPASCRPSSRRESRLVRFSPRQTAALQAVAREARVPLKSVLLAAHCRVLALAHGQDEITTGLAFNGRAEEEGGDQVLGLFVNVLPLTARPLEGSWIELARRLFDAERERLPHRRFPMAQLTEMAGGPLFETMFNFVHFHVYQDLEKLGIRRLGERFHAVNNFTFWINSVVDPWDGSLTLRLGGDPDQLAGAQLGALCGWYERTLAAIGAAPREPTELSPLGDSERHQLLVEWNGSPERFEVGCLHEGFAAQARRRPDAVALSWQDEALSYGELARRSGRLAWRLRELGVGPEVAVALCLERGPDLVVAVLGVLAAGGAYVPIDPAYPAERQELLLADSGARVLLSERRLAGALAGSRALPVWLEDVDLSAGRQVGDSGAGAANLAYVIYTSGSTGRPKGVQVAHGHAVRLFAATAGWFGFGAGDVWTLFHSYAFDFSVWEIWGALLHGGRLVVVPYWVSRAPDAFHALLRREAVTVLNQTTPAFHQLAAADAASPAALGALRWLYVGGEALEPGSLRPWFTRYGEDRPRLVNVYGITETTVLNSWRRMGWRDLERGGSPIGMVFRDQTLRIFDRRLQPVPVGVPGELCLGGAGLTRGYLGRPELTAERFVPDPFGSAPGDRLYRSGDLARYRPDGELDYAGRLDRQIKIRGYRIELGEIEAALARHPAVRQSLVLARRREDGLDQLVAYLVAGEAATGEEVRAFLVRELPGHMVPELFVRLAAMPLTPNGKVDRKALPAPETATETARQGYVAPRTPVEEILAGIWARLFGRERIGVDDDFFEIGGHSLLATRVTLRVKEVFGVELPLRTLFEAPTVAGLAVAVEALRSAGGAADEWPPLRRGEHGGPLPLSPAQQRFWFLHLLNLESSAFNMHRGIRLSGRLQAAVLAASFGEIVRRHGALRTRFASAAGVPCQIVDPPGRFRLPQVDLSGLRARTRERELRRVAESAARRPFHLAAEAPLRIQLLRLADDEHAVLFSLHHIAGDGWSLELMTRELGELYAAGIAGRPSPLPELPVQYTDWAVAQQEWLRGPGAAAQLAWWRRRLGGELPAMALPMQRRPPAVRRFRGAACRLALGTELSAAMAELGKSAGATLFMCLLAAFKALLHLVTGSEDLLVGTNVANRERTGVEGLVGLFVNDLALRTDLSGRPSFRELLARVRETVLDAHAHQDLPFATIVADLRVERTTSPLFQAMFVLQSFFQSMRALPGLTHGALEAEPRTANFDLTLMLSPGPDGLAGAFLYDLDLFDAATIGRLAEAFVELLRQVAADPDLPIDSLSLAAPAAAAPLVSAFSEEL